MSSTHGKLTKPLDCRLSTVKPFSGTIYFQYAKSAKFYLQLMDVLSIDYPWMYNLFQQGYYTIRRSDQFWAGLWTVFNWKCQESWRVNQKSKNGRVNRFIVGVSGRKCAEVYETMTELSGSKHTTNKQHVKVGTSRKS